MLSMKTVFVFLVIGCSATDVVSQVGGTDTTDEFIIVRYRVLRFQGGAPPHRGYHPAGTSSIHVPRNYTLNDLVTKLKKQLDPEDHYDLTFFIERGTKEESVHPEMNVVDVFSQHSGKTSVTLLVRIPLKRGNVDIGNFADEKESVGAELLQTDMLQNQQNLSTIISILHGNPNATFTSLPQILSSEECEQLRKKVDNSFEGAGMNARDDYKLNLSEKDLENLLGENKVQEMKTKFGVEIDEIIIRRCSAHNKFIKFHLDHATRTMQVFFSLHLSFCSYIFFIF
jgi:uncharacterized protein YidB (DUF937 family)